MTLSKVSSLVVLVYCHNFIAVLVFNELCLATEYDLFFGNGISHLFDRNTNSGQPMNPTGPFYCTNPLSRKQTKDVLSWDRRVLLPDELKLPVSFCSRLNPDGNSAFHFELFLGSLDKCSKSWNVIPKELCQILQNDHDGENDELEASNTQLKEYAEILVDNSLLDVNSPDPNVNSHIAYGGLLAVMGRTKEAEDYFKMIMEEYAEEAAVYYMSGMILLQDHVDLDAVWTATSHFQKCSALDSSKWECLEKEAEMLFGLQEYKQALRQVDKAISLNPISRLYFLKGSLEFHEGDLVSAEQSFRTCARMGNYKKTETLFSLASVLFQRGKLRNAVEVYRDILKENKTHVQAALSLAQVYYELGNYPHAIRAINGVLVNHNSTVRGLQLQAMLFYYSGQPQMAQKSIDNCLDLNPDNQACLYLSGLSHLAQGHLFKAIKSYSKLIVLSKHPALKASTEFQRAHYLREYARYLHWKLDMPLDALNLDTDLCADFKTGWTKAEIWEKYTSSCMKQKEITINVPDVLDYTIESYSPEMQKMLCFTKRIGQLAEINSDGFLTNKRALMAVGLGALHIAQKLGLAWKQLKSKKSVVYIAWEEIYQIAVRYQQLVDPEIPILWHSHMAQYHDLKDSIKTDIHFLNGYTINVRMAPYFDLVFRLVRSMIDSYNGGGVISSASFREDIQNTESFDDLIQVIKQNELKEQGFVISTQVPSLRQPESVRFEGVMIMLTGANEGRVEFALNHVFSKTRNEAFSEEIQVLLGDLIQQVQRRGVCCVEQDRMLNTLLSIIYYLYNLMPLNKGSSLATYTVLAGMLLSLGREVTGKIPSGKQPEMEAILSGAPDAFATVTQQWYNIQRLNTSVFDYPLIWEQLPTPRRALEVLNLVSLNC